MELRRAFRAILALTLGLCAPVATPAATLTVDGSLCALGDAIVAANTDTTTGGCAAGDPGADTLVLDADVVLSTAETVRATRQQGHFGGLPDVTSEITIQAGLADRVTRDPSLGCFPDMPNRFRIVNVVEGQLTLSGITAAHGCASTGGGFFVGRGSLTVENSTLEQHTALATTVRSEGGAVVVSELGELTVTDSVFSENRAGGNILSAQGGAIAVQLNGRIVSIGGSTFEGNEARGESPPGSNQVLGRGGAIFFFQGDQFGPITNSLFSNNAAVGSSSFADDGGDAYGGAIMVEETSTGSVNSIELISGSTFVNNRAEGGASEESRGGDAFGGAISGGTGVVRDSSFDGNQAIGGASPASLGGRSWGGALFQPSDELVNTRFRGNVSQGGSGRLGAAGVAGGVYVSSSLAELRRIEDVTFENNAARGGDGLDNRGSAEGGAFLGFSGPDFLNVTLSSNLAAVGAG
ncbi:MAG: hypothetical protein AAFY88_23800, partial [Acidobacteriota bacterium]